ncbi:MAG: hypothetical protein P9X27_01345 [Candidatus Kaelpia aquatica]|nr:hypothetical protein [Candidatus Kaelpia aquatica]
MALFGIFKSKSEKIKKVVAKPTKKKIVSNKKAVSQKSDLVKARLNVKKVTKKAAVRKKSEIVKPVKKVKPKEVGRVTHYFGKISVGIIKLKTPLEVGAKIHIKGAHDDFKQTVKSMQIDHKSVAKANKGEEAGIKVIKKVHENDRVYMVEQ